MSARVRSTAATLRMPRAASAPSTYLPARPRRRRAAAPPSSAIRALGHRARPATAAPRDAARPRGAGLVERAAHVVARAGDEGEPAWSASSSARSAATAGRGWHPAPNSGIGVVAHRCRRAGTRTTGNADVGGRVPDTHPQAAPARSCRAARLTPDRRWWPDRSRSGAAPRRAAQRARASPRRARSARVRPCSNGLVAVVARRRGRWW